MAAPRRRYGEAAGASFTIASVPFGAGVLSRVQFTTVERSVGLGAAQLTQLLNFTVHELNESVTSQVVSMGSYRNHTAMI